MVSAAARETGALRERVAAQEGEIAALRARIAIAERRDAGDTAALAQQLAANDRRIAELSSERTGQEEECARLRQALEVTGRERETLARQVAELQRASTETAALVDTLRAERAIRDELITSLERHAGEVERERDALRGRIAAYKQTGVAHLDELFRLCAELTRRSVLSEHELHRDKGELTTDPAPSEGDPSGLLARSRR